MAIITEEEILNSLLPKQESPEEDKIPEDPNQKASEGPGLLSTIKNAADQNNATYSIAKHGFRDRVISDPKYPRFEKIKGTILEDNPEAAIYVDSDEELEKAIEKEEHNRKTQEILSEAGWTGTFAAIGTAILDPIAMFAPGGALIKSVKVAKSGSKLAKGAIGGAAAGATGEFTQSIILQQTTGNLNQQDVLANTIAGTFLGTALGGSFGAFASKTAQRAANAEVKAAINDIESKIDLQAFDDGVGAARNIQFKAGESSYAIPDSVMKYGTADFSIFRKPYVMGQTSKSGTVKAFANEMFEHSNILVKNVEGIASEASVESLIRADIAQLQAVHNKADDFYFSYLGIDRGRTRTGTAFRAKRSASTQGKMTKAEFNEEVAKARRNNDTHSIPEVADAAKLYGKVIDDVANQLQKLGLLPEELMVRGSKSYLSRVWDIPKIMTNSDEFISRLAKSFQNTAAKRGKTLDDDDAMLAAQDTYYNMQGIGDKQLSTLGLVKDAAIRSKSGKITKNRVLDVDESEFSDFLVNDIEDIMNSYIHQSSSLVHLNTLLNRWGASSIGDIKAKIREDYADIIRKNPGKEEKLGKELRQDLDYVDDVVRLITGQMKAPSQTTKYLMQYNFMRLLGGVTISSVPDLMMPFFVNGPIRALRIHGQQLMGAFKGTKSTVQEYKRFGMALEVEMNNTIEVLLGGVGTSTQRGSKVSRTVDGITDLFTEATGINQWNLSNKIVSARISASRSLEVLRKWDRTGKIDKIEQTRLAQLGIGKEDYKAIVEQSKLFDEKIGPTISNRLEAWTDKAAAKKFGLALVKDVNKSIITPSKGDIPLFFKDSDIGRVVGQFRSFASAAGLRITMSTVQRIAMGDMRAAAGIVMLIHMGGMVEMAKRKMRGQDDEMSYGEFILAGTTRSGVFGLMGDLVFSTALLKDYSRYQGLNMQGAILGPSANLINDLVNAGAPIFQKALDEDKDLEPKDIKRIARMIPYQNLFYLQYILTKVFDEEGEED